MKVFAINSYHQRFVDQDMLGECEVARFANGELHVTVTSDVAGQDCAVVGSLAPPDEQLLSVLMLADALKQAGARTIEVYLPYLGYGRQDKPTPGESGVALVGKLLNAAGIESVTTIDVHSPLDRRLIGLSLNSLSAAALFASSIIEMGWEKAIIVAPDKGAMERAEDLASRIGSDTSPTHLVKQHIDGVKHLELVGSVGERVIIVDDILDTGGTLVSACELLQTKGVKEILVVVTHGLFTGDAWQRLFSLGVANLLVSDSCPAALQQNHPQIRPVAIPVQFWKGKE